MKKILEKSGNLSEEKSGNPEMGKDLKLAKIRNFLIRIRLSLYCFIFKSSQYLNNNRSNWNYFALNI